MGRVMIAITVLSLNFVGDGVRDVLDPYQVSKAKVDKERGQ